MPHFLRSVLAITAVMVSPIAMVTMAFPFAVGIGLGVFSQPSARLIALAMWAPVGVTLLRHLLRDAPLRVAVRRKPRAYPAD